MKNVFEELRADVPYDIRDKDYQEQAHGEMDRSRQPSIRPGCGW